MLDVFLLIGGLGACFGVAMWLMGNSPSAAAAKRTIADFVMNGHANRWFWAGVGALVVGSIVFVVARRGAARSSWDAFAAAHRLEVSDRSATKPLGRVHGHYGGRPFELTVVTRSDLHQRNHESHVRMSIRLDDPPPALSIVRRISMPGPFERLASTAANAVGIPDAIRTGDDAFDDVVTVRGENADEVRAWLTPIRRELIRELVDEDGYLVTADAVAWTSRFGATSRDELDRIAGRLDRFASRLR